MHYFLLISEMSLLFLLTCLCCNLQMFRQLFSTGGGTLTLIRLGLNQIKPSICVPTYSCSRPILPKLCLSRQFHSVLSISSELHCLSCQKAGQHIFHRAYTNESRRQQSYASYIIAVFIFMIGAAYAGVPLYRMICQVRGGVLTCYILCMYCI